MTLEGFTAQEPFYPKLYETMEEVPSNPNWVAFVRHAQAGHNVDRALIDKPDNPLTEVGVAQALKARLANIECRMFAPVDPMRLVEYLPRVRPRRVSPARPFVQRRSWSPAR